MVSFLTSSFVKYQTRKEYKPQPLIDENGFVDNLKKYWPAKARFLVFSSNPIDYSMTDHIITEITDSFSLSNIKINDIRFFDTRTVKAYAEKQSIPLDDSAYKLALKESMEWCNVFFLAGGHCPTENAFMKQCGLKEILQDQCIFDGIFLALSAGSVNAADNVYLLPEEKGEAIDSNFVKYTDGLGLTSLNIVPHIKHLETIQLDGLDYIDEIVKKDSYERELYLIPDGSYFIIKNGVTEFFGEGQIMYRGECWPLNSCIINGDNYLFKSRLYDGKSQTIILDSLMKDSCDFVFDIEIKTGKIRFYHISDYFLNHGIVPVHIDYMGELCAIFTQKLVVAEEKAPFLEQTNLSYVLGEIKNNGTYVRTVHIDTPTGVQAENIRIEPLLGTNSHLLCYLMNISFILDHDWMTDEYSRTGFINYGRELISTLSPEDGYSIVYSNIQGFKVINELFGARGGDMAIFHERDVLRRTLHPIMLARFESDHFVMLVKNEYLTEEILHDLCHQIYSEGYKQIPFTIRLGICNLTDVSEPVHLLIDHAKLAEKLIVESNGKPYIYYDEKMHSDYLEQRVLISELDEALDKCYIKTYYQPVVDIHTKEIVSAEALVRWQHPTRGMISPGLFVPALEQKGMISKIDYRMIKNVLNFNSDRLNERKKVVPCAVNLSRVDFYDTKLLGIIRSRVEESEDVGRMLKLEVTESAYAVLENNAIDFLNEMKKLNIALLLDDFGSGMSSMSTLESFEFDIIKLDMGFIRKIGKSAKTEAIIRTIINLSHAIGSQVVAEGVETKEQLDFLEEAGCDMIQGYYFYKPMTEEEFAKLLDE